MIYTFVLLVALGVNSSFSESDQTSNENPSINLLNGSSSETIAPTEIETVVETAEMVDADESSGDAGYDHEAIEVHVDQATTNEQSGLTTVSEEEGGGQSDSVDIDYKQEYARIKADFESYQEKTNTLIENLQSAIQGNARRFEHVTEELMVEIKRTEALRINSLERIQKNHEHLSEESEASKKVMGQKIQDLQQADLSTNDRLEQYDSAVRVNISELSESQGRYSVYGLASIAVLMALVVFSFLYSRKLISGSTADSNSRLLSARKEIDNSNMRLDGKLVDILESQLSIIDRQNASNGQEEDHTLTLKVADELVRIQKNLARMDSKTKGLKQLSLSVARIGDNFSSNGYEIVDMLDMPYREGMKVTANFVLDEGLEAGQQIITRIIKPQVNYQGVMIQSAQIEVSQGD